MRATSGIPARVEQRTASTPHLAEAWKPAPFDDADHRAFKALRDGMATPDQQQRALGWLLFASGLRADPYRPGGDGDRDTVYALGKQALGRQIYWFLEAAVPGSGNSEQGTR